MTYMILSFCVIHSCPKISLKSECDNWIDLYVNNAHRHISSTMSLYLSLHVSLVLLASLLLQGRLTFQCGIHSSFSLFLPLSAIGQVVDEPLLSIVYVKQVPSAFVSKSQCSNVLIPRLLQFELALKQTLREFNKTDRLKWTFRRPTAQDVLPTKYKNARLCLVIQISHYAEELPSYHTAVMSSSIVLDQQTLSPPPSYSQANLQDASSVSESTATSAPTLLYTSTNSSQTSLPLSHPEPAMVRTSTVVPSSTWCSSNTTTFNNQLHPYDSSPGVQRQRYP